ncbi:hypothetical protein NKG05_14090 [Oerskovia sp. M15]
MAVAAASAASRAGDPDRAVAIARKVVESTADDPSGRHRCGTSSPCTSWASSASRRSSSTRPLPSRCCPPSRRRATGPGRWPREPGPR